MGFTKTTLPNGLTVITSPLKGGPSVTVLVVVSVGSKYETKEINGVSHFLEHMCFKGTQKRPTALDISKELDGIGSQNNAFTDMELTGYYAKSHPSHFETILDVVSDIYLNPTFDPKEIEKEKGVIVEEINMYEDLPHRVVQDVFNEALYGDQPAGWSVLGTKESVTSMTQKDFIEYRTKHYIPQATTVVVSGNIDESVALSEITKVFGAIPEGKKEEKLPVVENQERPIIKIKTKDTDQMQVILGVRTFGSSDPRNSALRVLNSVLGSSSSSRLFYRLREEMGVGYYVRSNVEEYTDHGSFSVSAGIDPTRLEEVIQVILEECNRCTHELVPEHELKKAKEYLIGNLYLSLESSDSIAEYYAMQHILTDAPLTPDELALKIQKVTAEEVCDLARDIFKDSKLVLAVVGNIKDGLALEPLLHF